jgi:acetolactate synthase I/II/III large subunit
MKLSGAQIVWESLLKEGVTDVFGFPGGAILPIYDAMLDYPIHHVLVRHEQGAAHMADGYARASGKVGVAFATSGPGATNLVTGIATAMLDSTPMVCITAQVNSKLIGYDAFQEVDITGITMPITKHNTLVTRVEDISPALCEAFLIASSGRPGPVLVDITKDAQIGEMEWDPDACQKFKLPWRPDLQPGPGDYARAVELIRSAKRPVILAGSGALKARALDEVRQLAELTRTPIASTLLGLGVLPAAHPLNMGMMGMHGESWVNHAIQESDLLLAVGMRFDDRVTGNLKTYATLAKKIHFEIDPTEINKNVRVDVGLIGNLRETLTRLLPDLPACDHSDWLEHIDEMRAESLERDILHMPDDGHLHPPHVLNKLWELTGGEAVVVTDVGQHQMWTAQYYRPNRPYHLITSGGLGTMGFGLPAAIGAKVACPDAEVWVVAGDGGFQMTQAELSTLVQENIKVNIAVMNNGYLGMVRQWQELFYERRYAATPITSPDFVQIAAAHGIAGLRVQKRAEIAPAIVQARQIDGPVLIDFRVEPEENVFPMVPAGADLHNMLRRPRRDTQE